MAKSLCRENLTATRILVFFAAVVALIGSSPANEAPSSSDDTIRAAIAARLKALQSIGADFDMVTSYGKPNPRLNGSFGAIKLVQPREPLECSGKFSFLNGCARWQISLSGKSLERVKSGNVDQYLNFVAAYRKGRLEYMEHRLRYTNADGYIGKPVPPSIIEVGLGLRAPYTGQPGWITADRLSALPLAFDASGKPSLTEMQPNGDVFRWTFDPDHGYAQISFSVEGPPSAPASKKSLDGDVISDDFKLVDGIPAPFHIIHRICLGDGSAGFSQEATVHRYSINDPTNVDDRYILRWPKGAIVVDRRSGGLVRTTQEDHPLDDTTFGQLLQAQEESREEKLKAWASTHRGAATRP